MSERIASAAIMRRGRVYTLPPPARHRDVIELMFGENGIPVGGESDQGFVTDTGRFVGRRQAWIIAEAAGQIVERFEPEGILFSESLW